MASNSNQTYTTTVIINDAQAKQKMESLNGDIKGYRQEMDKAYTSGNKALGDQFAKKIKEAQKDLNRLKLETMDVSNILNNLSDASLSQLQKAAKSLRQEMKSLSISSQEFKEKAEQLKQVNTAMANARSEFAASSSWTSRLADGFNKWQGAIIGAAGALTGLTLTVRKTVQAYSDMEEKMADVRKYTGMTDEEIRDLNEDLKKMDTRTSRERLNELAGDAGRLGIKGKEGILEFVEAANTINIALGDDLGEGAVRAIGKLSETFGDSDRMGLKNAMIATGSAVNELAQSSSASAGYIVDFTAKIAGSANQAHIAQTNIMGYAAVLDQNMQQMETSSTALSQLITKMFQDPAKFAKLAGKDVKEFTELLSHDANEALLQFLGTMQAKGGFDSLAPMFSEMGLNGTRAVGVLSTLATNLEEIKVQQEIATEAFREGNSVLDEATIKENTVQAGIEKATKAFKEIAIELGSSLAPIAKYTITTFGILVRVLTTLIDVVKNCRVTIIAATVALVAWNAAAIKALVIEKVTVALKACRTAFLALNKAIKANPWLALATAVAAVTAAVVDYILSTKDATKTTDQMSAAAKRQKEAQDAIKKTSGELISKYQLLSDQWRKLSTEQEKMKWIQANQEAFRELGLAINSVNDANKLLIKDSNKVIEALRATAEATIYGRQYEKALEEEITFKEKHGVQVNGNVRTQNVSYVKATGLNTSQLTQEEIKALTDAGHKIGGYVRKLTDEEVKAVNAHRYKVALAAQNKTLTDLQKAREDTEKKLAAAQRKVQAAMNSNTISPTAGGGSDTSSSGSSKSSKEDPLKKREQEMKAIYDAQALLIKEAHASDIQSAILTNEQKKQAEQDYNEAMYELKQTYYSKCRDLYAEDSAQWKQWETKRLDEQISHDKKAAEEQTKVLKKEVSDRQKILDDARKEYGSMMQEIAPVSNEDELESQKRRLMEIDAMMTKFYEDGLISEEQYQQGLDAIRAAYNEVQQEQTKKQIKTTQEAVAFALQQVSTIVSGISSYISASYQAEIAECEARYDTEIKAAKKAGKDTTKLEEKKQKELNAIKLRQINAETDMNIAEAMVNTALGVTMALRQGGGIFGPILAAVVTAMGMLQLATIQKQSEAKKAALASGYYEGGYTGGRDYRREAGVVHEGEFVANHQAVNNPSLTPVFDLLDYAQRTNRVASLQADDIANVMGSPASQVVTPVINVQNNDERLNKTLNEVSDSVSQLSKQIEDGIETKFVMADFVKEKKHYDKLVGA